MPPPPASAPTVSSLVPTSKYPAHHHLSKVLSVLASLLPASSAAPSGQLFLRGTPSRLHEDSDQAVAFRQRRAFLYLTGCELPDSCVVYSLDATPPHSTLFIPPVVDADVVWSGLPTLPAEARARYDVDSVSDGGEAAIAALLRAGPGPIWTLDLAHLPAGVLGPSPPAQRAADPALLRRAIDGARVTKTPHELALLRAASAITSRAHLAAMRAGRRATHEAQLEAAFHAACIAAGARTQAYDSIVASGADAATLHYVRNDKAIVRGSRGGAAADTLNVLVDAGCEVRGYAADVTRTFPAGGRWSAESRAIYAVVLAMQTASMRMLRDGVRWEDVHARAHRVGIAGLLALGILRRGGDGGTGGDGDADTQTEDEVVERILDSRVSTAFFPHGLGHYLGLDTHDTGGHADYSDPDPLFRYLRVRGAVPAGAVITVEPGIYFCRYIVEPMLATPEGTKYVDADVLERYWTVGGVRIEDDVLVGDEGCENLTDVPSGADEIEEVMARGEEEDALL